MVMIVPATVFQGLLMRKSVRFIVPVNSLEAVTSLDTRYRIISFRSLCSACEKCVIFFSKIYRFFKIYIILFNIMLRTPDLPRKVLQMYSEI